MLRLGFPLGAKFASIDFSHRLASGAASILLLANALGCAGSAPRTPHGSTDAGETPPASAEPTRISDLRLRGFSDDSELHGYLTRLLALDHERMAYERRRWERIAEAARASASESRLAGLEIEEILISGESAPMEPAPMESVVAFTSFKAASIADLANYTPNLEITAADDSLTNNQESGVDEGDIVKRIGNYILLLRRGRLFSFDIGERAGFPLALVDRVDLPTELPENGKEVDAWYDELLVDGSTIVVVGYNYGLDATEISLLELSSLGRFTRRDTIYLTSSDYYSGSNYASRLVDGDLVIYTAVPLDRSLSEASGMFPLSESLAVLWPMRVHFTTGGEVEYFESLVLEARVYASFQASAAWPVINTVLRCPLREPEFRCTATGIIGPEGEAHYISQDAFYLWLTSGSTTIDVDQIDIVEYREELERNESAEHDGDEATVVYRIPLRANSEYPDVGAVEIRGFPFDQFSFRESDGVLDLFTLDGRDNDGESPIEDGDLFARLIEIPLADFNGDITPWSEVAWQELPLDSDCVMNRFIGAHLVYTECFWEAPESASRGLVRIKEVGNNRVPGEIAMDRLPLRLETLGDAAIIASAEGDSSDKAPPAGFHLESLALDPFPEIVDSVFVKSRFPDHGRSHAFNFAPFGNGRIIALPLDRIGDLERFDENRIPLPVEIHYFEVERDLEINPMGQVVQSETALAKEDDCRASCADWYGTARPFFIGSRVFGLIDYELIEAKTTRGRVIETDRVSALPD